MNHAPAAAGATHGLVSICDANCDKLPEFRWAIIWPAVAAGQAAFCRWNPFAAPQEPPGLTEAGDRWPRNTTPNYSGPAARPTPPQGTSDQPRRRDCGRR